MSYMYVYTKSNTTTPHINIHKQFLYMISQLEKIGMLHFFLIATFMISQWKATGIHGREDMANDAIEEKLDKALRTIGWIQLCPNFKLYC